MGIKYTIEGFSQEQAVKLGLTAEDLVILRWFVDFWPSPGMLKMNHDGKEYGLVSYSGFIDQMPIVGCNKRTIARKFQRLVDAEVLENTTIKQGGSFSVYRFGKNYSPLVQKCTTVDNSQHTVAENSAYGLHNNEQPGLYENEHTNTLPLNSTSQLRTNNINTQDGAKPQSSNSFDYELFRGIYNSTCTNLASCRKITDKRKKAIKAFFKEYGLDDWKEVCGKANMSPFLTGDNDTGWEADIDFLLRVDKASKILEGGYQASGKKEQPEQKKETAEDRWGHPGQFV